MDNWQLLFGGIGTAVIAAVVGAWAKYYFDRRANTGKSNPKQHAINQKASGGKGSQIVQAGRDANLGDTKPKS